MISAIIPGLRVSVLAVSEDDQKAEMEMDRAHPLQTNIKCHKTGPLLESSG